MAPIGRNEKFHDDKENWDKDVERLKHFFAADGFTEAEKK